ncbi:hypothetical protein CROQUDRAFT_95434 [Cronartium quercuum f. sp. fusiforme G11]|uniref:Uncharacterized protein n=1 Tax=Cronartium quercuum f. sp. fusiforme G11 TaxID=708437 RepID=A0A9P6NCE4_9BASI|nr:hypothetical protein CROQUDRAFT_95434 [Cronartium quercuum f. sp. fusiforme G11]
MSTQANKFNRSKASRHDKTLYFLDKGTDRPLRCIVSFSADEKIPSSRPLKYQASCPPTMRRRQRFSSLSWRVAQMIVHCTSRCQMNRGLFQLSIFTGNLLNAHYAMISDILDLEVSQGITHHITPLINSPILFQAQIDPRGLSPDPISSSLESTSGGEKSEAITLHLQTSTCI